MKNPLKSCHFICYADSQIKQGIISLDFLLLLIHLRPRPDPATAPHTQDLRGSSGGSSLGKWLTFLQIQKYVFDPNCWEEEDRYDLENYLCGKNQKGSYSATSAGYSRLFRELDSRNMSDVKSRYVCK